MFQSAGRLPSRSRIAFVVNADWFFLSHRLPVARAAREAGAEVTVVAGDTGCGPAVEREGFQFVSLPISRSALSPVGEVRTLAFLVDLYRRLRPTLVHHVTIKPVLYGSVAARIVGDMAVVNAVSGLGWVFGPSYAARAIRPFVRMLYRLALHHRHSRTIFQNPENRDEFVTRGLVPEHQSVLIRGSGVDCRRFAPTPEPSDRPVVLLACRMLWDKGVKEFVEAARIVNAREPRARFVLAGTADLGNPSAVPIDRLQAWARAGVVEWWGHCSDMPAVLARSHVVVLPTTYPEGVPKVLLEAAACGRSIVATDTPGCREIVRHGVNGLLVPPRDASRLAAAILTLVENPALRRGFGVAGRDLAMREFSEELVVADTLALYRDLLADRWPEMAFPRLLEQS